MEAHDVVRECAQPEFGELRGGPTGRERRAEPALVLTEGALRMPALAVGVLREALAHRAPVRRVGPAPLPARIELDDALAHAQRLATEAMIMLGVVAGIGEHGVDPLGPRPRGGVREHRRERGRVLRGPVLGDRAQDEVGGNVPRDGQLGPAALLLPAVAPLGPAPAEVCRAVMRLEPRGVDSEPVAPVPGAREEAEVLGAPAAGEQRASEGPLFSASSGPSGGSTRCAA